MSLFATAKKPAKNTPRQTKPSVKNAHKTPVSSTQTHLRIAEVRDNVLVLKNGGLRTILKTSSINFNLKSEDEQNAIIYSYQSFLNTLEFPLQIVVRSKKLDIDNYIEDLKQKGEKQANPLLQRQTFEYAEYIQKLIEYADIMEKEFYVIVPYDPYRAKKMSLLAKFMKWMHPQDTATDIKARHREFDDLKKGLNQRINIVKSNLENCGLKVTPLTTSEIIELFYNSYNPIISRGEKVKNINDVNITSDEENAKDDEEKA